MGGGSGSTNTIQSTTPWAGQQPDLQDIYDTAYNLNQSTTPQYYPGDTYSGLTANQQNAANEAYAFGESGGSGALQAANSNIASTLSPDYTSGTSGAFGQGQSVLSNELGSDYLNPWNSSSFGTVVDNTLASAIPAATSSFIGGNRADSGLATEAATQAATNAVGNLAQSQYNTDQQIQNSAAAQAANNYLTQQGNQVKTDLAAPSVDQEQLSDQNAALQAAGMDQTNNQNQINADIAAYNYGQMLPWNQLGLYENAVTGTGQTGSTTSTQQPYYSNTTANLLGGATSAIGATAALGSLTAAPGGGAFSALAPYFAAFGL